MKFKNDIGTGARHTTHIGATNRNHSASLIVCGKMNPTHDELIKKNLSKGQEIILEGRLVNQSYENKNGDKRFSTQIEMNDYYIIKTNNAEKSESTVTEKIASK